ncbi:MAG: hypothetical protein GEV03_14300 [Streptosporangiales bacterium]|nr:hypothetical protein [Streptosporangiales bacterium]
MSGGRDEGRVVGAGAAVVTAAVTLALWVWLGWAMAGDDPSTVAGAASAVVFVGLPFAAAAAAVAWHVARAAHGPDVPARLLALTTAGRHGRREEWGAAMRAELASIPDARERRGFALGCALTALRTGWGRAPWLVATVCFVGFAAITFAESRIMLAGDQVGILAGALMSVPLFFAIALVAARAVRSFRAGLESGVLALLAAVAGVLVVAAPEAITWYHEAGVWIIDGDFPKGGIAGPGEAVRDALGGVTFFYLLFNAPWPVIGAALGAWRRRRPEADAPPAVAPAGSPGSARSPLPSQRGTGLS